MKTARHSLCMLLAISMFCSVMSAQQTSSSTQPVVPRLVNFSGRATDAQGKVISGIAGATFAIYKEDSGGSPLWLETQNIQADAKGNYTAQLGATKPDGLPLDLFSSGEARWLAVTVNGGQEQPRGLLLSVPYALKAADSETIGGLPASAFVLANKSQASGTSTKATPASTSAAKNAAPPANPAVTGKGVLDFIPMWDTTSDIVDSILFQKSSQIGINTTSPAATLDVNGKSDVRDTLTLFPKGTDSTLAVNGTTFKVDQTGKVTFISGQGFPGTGTVTSVGLSAPSSDFTVSGSPVTKSGTLNLKWSTAPTNADTANAIVKRDSLGGFSAGAITGTLGVTGLSASSAALTGTNTFSGYGVYGTSNSGTAIWGQSFGTGTTSTGVEGVTNSATAYGVAGSNGGNGVGVFGTSVSGHGVYGSTGGAGSYGVVGVNSATGGSGVFGTAPNGDGFYTDSNVQQARTMGGWVKAMVYVNAMTPPYSIVRCFNSTLAGLAATTPPCGINFTENQFGDWLLDFGFEVDDRFVSATLSQVAINGDNASCISGYPGGLSNPNGVEVMTWDCGSTAKGAVFHLIVF